MKRITKLHQLLQTIHGVPYEPAKDLVEGKIVSTPFTHRFIIMNLLGLAKGGKKPEEALTGEEKIAAVHLAIKIRECKENEIEVEDADAKLLKRVIDDAPDVSPTIYTQLVESIVPTESKQ